MTNESLPGADAEFTPFPLLIEQHASTHGDGTAFICDGQTLTWKQLSQNISQVAKACRDMQVNSNDKVALIATTSLEAMSTFFGVIGAGGCIVPLATSATPSALLAMLRDSDAKIVVVSADMRASIQDIERSLLDEFSGRAVSIGFSGDGWLQWDSWIEKTERKPAAESPQKEVLTPGQHFNIIYSSGTTGQPKGILHLHGMRHRQASRRSFKLDTNSVMLLSTPIYSNTTIQPMLATLAAGGTTVLMSKFNAAAYLAICETHRVTHTMLVPVQYQRILDCDEFAKTDLSSFVLKQCTGAPLDAALKARIQKQWPGGLREIYGMTEGGCSCVLDADAYPDKLGTVGKPAPNHDMRIVDDAGRELAHGEAGEIVGRSPYMMACYYKRPEATEDFYWRDELGHVFHRSGDIGRFDADGFLTLLDRKKDMIISGGFNIYAADLEAVLHSHPQVVECTVIGIPSPQWGETPLALVVLKPEALIGAEELLAWANTQVGKTQRLSAIELRSELPRSALGKVLKRELRERYWKESRTPA